MDYRSQEDHSMGIPTPASSSLASNNNNNPCPNPIRVSAFSKPNSSSSPKDHRTPIRNGSSAYSHDHLGPLPSSDNSAADHHHHLPPPAAADPVPLGAASASTPKSATSLKYRECLRNHAAAIGGHVLDGCCEFMPGDADPLKCAACDCHRSFHRKQTEGGGLDSYYHHHRKDRISVPLLLPPPHPLTHTAATQHKHQNPCAFPAAAFGGGGGGGNNSGSGATTESSSEERLDHQAGGGPTPPASKKRFRTKFTAEQKEKMMGFAERVGWRIQRQDNGTVEEFCREAGVTRQVLRVWMHNNKHHSIKKQETTTAAAAAAEHCVSAAAAISTATNGGMMRGEI